MSFSDFLFYFELGWSHIVSLDALDHQLFILALIAVYTSKQVKQILILVTAFTVGHSITLALSTFDIIRFDSKWVEFLIPCTIFVTAIANLFKNDKRKKNVQLNYYLALFFGLIHGMGFANSVRMMLAKDQYIGWGLFGFNLGLEVGQIIFVVLTMLISGIFLYFFKVRQRDWVIFVSSAVFALALQMALQRIPF
ncbi:HupE/UreJ family protein [Pedobacter chitinilyticus]|uniref:HupE/UreJ family protein n=1 Tax=Pedobacter chitinilyticus TaxID=2233776 RepID=A0A3S3SQS7_9SPHI|nr:HupE/UreJ family protein [Pedobacter chitinilyticus]RWU06221.1 HupE/UreJ family protein [Pedobacter chitinilyticus]